jgi:hypothetical protein
MQRAGRDARVSREVNAALAQVERELIAIIKKICAPRYKQKETISPAQAYRLANQRHRGPGPTPARLMYKIQNGSKVP